MITFTPLTAEAFFNLPDEINRRDLVEGEIRTMAAAGAEHGLIGARITRIVSGYVEAHHLGECFGAETGFTLARNPDTVLAPDLAFVQATHIPSTGVPQGFWEMVPDLVAEIVSPGDRPGEVGTKIGIYLQRGVRLIWVLYPDRREVVVHQPGGTPRTLGLDDTLDGGDVLPGFSCTVRDLWPARMRPAQS